MATPEIPLPKERPLWYLGFLSVSQKEPLQERYDQHIREKVEVRKRKEEAKVEAQDNRDFCAAVFDLQQLSTSLNLREAGCFIRGPWLITISLCIILLSKMVRVICRMKDRHEVELVR